MPVGGGTEQGVELLQWLCQSVGKKKRIRLSAALCVFVGRFGSDQLEVPLSRRAILKLAERLPALWAQLDQPSLMVCIKLITGSFRVGVSKLLVTRALAALADLDSKRVAQRLVGYTDLSNRPTAEG